MCGGGGGGGGGAELRRDCFALFRHWELLTPLASFGRFSSLETFNPTDHVFALFRH